MLKPKLTLSAKILLTLYSLHDLMPRYRPMATVWREEPFSKTPFKKYADELYRLEKRGLIKIFKDKDEKFIKLTEKGAIETLIKKARFPQKAKWDGRWRIFMFDIPEKFRKERGKIRSLLKANGYHKLQASVFVNPFPLNREAVEYLKKSGLIEYIRLVKAEEIDDDSELRKKFGL